MPRQKTILRLDPDRCDRCGRCERVCERGAIKVGPSYIYVDWRACDQCGRCIEVCDRGAITRREGSGSKPARKRGTGPAPRRRAKPGKKKAAESRPEAVAAEATLAGGDGVGSAFGWTLLEAFALLAVVFVAFMLKDTVLTSAWADSMRPSALVWLRVVALAVFYTVQISALLFLAHRRRVGLLDAVHMGWADSSWRSKGISALWVAGLLVAMRLFAWIYGVSAQALGWDPPVRWNSNLTDVFGPGSVGLVLAVLMVVLVGPVIEEMVFRGVLLPAFDARVGRWMALAISSALFAGYHFNPWLFIPTFALGFTAGWLALKRESLWPAIALHSLYNVIPVAMAFYLVR